jgi:hypothetical protein
MSGHFAKAAGIVAVSAKGRVRHVASRDATRAPAKPEPSLSNAEIELYAYK